MTGPRPLVTVVIPVQDRIEYLGAALASVREQTLADFEVVVVDAGSVQPVDRLVRAVAAADPRFRLLRSDERISSPVARNLGMDAARGDLIAHLDSDDLMSPTRLERQARAFAERPDLVCAAGCMRMIGPHGLGRPAGEDPAPAGTELTDALVRWCFPFEMPSLTSALTMSTVALRGIGGFDGAYAHCDDYGTLRLLLEQGRVIRLADVVADYRRHDGQVSSVRPFEQQAQLALLRRDVMSERLGRRVPLGPVVALTVPLLARPDQVGAAEDLCDELLARFLDATPLDEREEAWVRSDHARRRARVSAARDRAAAPSTVPPSQA
jgi:glycosyltransferase involved in cell wall biosynthesis